VFTIAGRCGIAPTSSAVAVNITVTQPTDAGYLVIVPTTLGVGETSAINFGAGQTRANNAIVTLGTDGVVAVRCGMPTGGVHFILDVVGYFD
jgi:hypothetical protein